MAALCWTMEKKFVGGSVFGSAKEMPEKIGVQSY
jgi:hypothetical protein